MSARNKQVDFRIESLLRKAWQSPDTAARGLIEWTDFGDSQYRNGLKVSLHRRSEVPR